MRQFCTIAFMLLLTACICAPEAKAPYPFAATYLSPADVPADVLPPPVSRNSAQYRAELATILDAQTSITEAEKTALNNEVKVTPEMVTLPVLGASFNRTVLPHTFALLDHIGSDNWRISDAAKNYWNTSRPFIEDNRVKALVPPLYQPAYPSGHTSAAGIWSEILVQLLPRYAEPLRARANEIALHRIAAGMHYPHDIEGGRKLVQNELAQLATHAVFQHDLQAARIELAKKGWLSRYPKNSFLITFAL